MGERTGLQMSRDDERALASWKGRDGTKGAPMGPPLRAEAAKGAYFAAKFGLHRRIVKWRAPDRGFLTRKGRVAWRGALSPLWKPSINRGQAGRCTRCHRG